MTWQWLQINYNNYVNCNLQAYKNWCSCMGMEVMAVGPGVGCCFPLTLSIYPSPSIHLSIDVQLVQEKGADVDIFRKTHSLRIIPQFMWTFSPLTRGWTQQEVASILRTFSRMTMVLGTHDLLPCVSQEHIHSYFQVEIQFCSQIPPPFHPLPYSFS